MSHQWVMAGLCTILIQVSSRTAVAYRIPLRSGCDVGIYPCMQQSPHAGLVLLLYGLGQVARQVARRAGRQGE